ncbi:MAG TPA: ABC-F family ATP-binding cassette domain-containing protein [Clostridiales bacterium]|nr:ABC-F family ATP-binding cassette domain-containing protein [Clostridiales bacterium]
MILSCNNISMSFGINQILKNISFHINEYDKVAVVGINGSGKSTLFKVIINELQQDEGDVYIAKGATIGYLAQHQGLTSDNSIYEELLSVKQDIIELNSKIRSIELEMKLATGTQLDLLLNQYSRLMHEFEINNGYAYKSEVIGILKGLGFDENEFDKKINTLSGGQRTRVALGKLLLTTPDIILLDEPTNNLDLLSISWLETYLQNYNGTVVVISHDRYFIDKVVNKVIEIENTSVKTYTGNYSDYSEKKAMLHNALLKQYMNQQKEIKHQEEVINKLKSFNREKSIKRAESREKLLNKIERLDKPSSESLKIHFSLEPRVQSGNDVLKVKGLSKSFADNNLFENLDFEVKRGEKLAIIGYNGTGKTTILKIITDNIEADSGEIKLGSKVHIGYYDQEHDVLEMDKTLFDELQDTYPHLDNTTIRNILAAFLFTEDDVFKLIKDLSGGERGRVSLAKLMLSEANLLILDEPTNHLDIDSKEILENALNHYSGTVIYVSHDRYFINKTASRILDLTNKKLVNYIGNYDYYLEKKDELEAIYFKNNNDVNVSDNYSNENNISEGKLNWQQQKEEQARIRKLTNSLAKIEDEIHNIEQRSLEIDNLLALEEIYTNVDKLVPLNNEKELIEAKLESLLEEWEDLSSEVLI